MNTFRLILIEFALFAWRECLKYSFTLKIPYLDACSIFLGTYLDFPSLICVLSTLHAGKEWEDRSIREWPQPQSESIPRVFGWHLFLLCLCIRTSLINYFFQFILQQVDKFRELYLTEQEQKLDLECELKDCKVHKMDFFFPP